MKEIKNPHCKLIYGWNCAEVYLRDRVFVRGNNLKVVWHKRDGEVHIICTTKEQRKCVVDEIGEPLKEIVVKNYQTGTFSRISQEAKAGLNDAGVIMVSWGNIIQLVFPSRKACVSFENHFLSGATA